MAGIENLHLRQIENYRFEVIFNTSQAPFIVDEAPPLGDGVGPTPVQLLTAAIANCLSASILFALRKFKLDPGTVSADAFASVGRNAENLLRVQKITVNLKLGKSAASFDYLDRVLTQFEKYCTVTQSINQSIAVEVSVFDVNGKKLK
ncbi:MAG: OsmC family protein [Burkholderiales bacterium]